MLGKEFFDWTESLDTAQYYEGVASALTDSTLASLLGAGELRIEEEFRDDRPLVRRGVGGEGKPLQAALLDCASSRVRWQVWPGGAQPQLGAEEEERRRVAILLARASLRRIVAAIHERKVRERLFTMRRQPQIAVFIIHGDTVLPYNPGAVAYAEAYWGDDEQERRLRPEVAEMFQQQLRASWLDPVEPRWISVELDLGGGKLEIPVLARHDGGAVLMFSPPPIEQRANEVPQLTRRQRTIMDWIAEGKTSAEVAMILDISPRTVEKHLESVFQRFGVENRIAAVRTYLDIKAGRDPRL